MKKKDSLKKSYMKMLEWYQYRAEENTGSLKKLQKLLAELDRESEASEAYEKDVDDLESLKFIYETGIRNFESQVEKYKAMIAEM
ncbi:hypothetical protein [Dyadobacter sp. Leaf189]|uniref:hypothetical protein n=1 Tax=unclassified Dyadobacter TaxID=2625061 RepID=UPI0007002BE7|nr:hypothetical protein [Dyadobacter sp. Leaf189]KQS33946.1 hypothetical protein ASG33_07905 [Dyadobacter sp. Leaf189]